MGQTWNHQQALTFKEGDSLVAYFSSPVGGKLYMWGGGY